MTLKVESFRELLAETSYPQRTKDALVLAYERNDPRYRSFFETIFPDLFPMKGGSVSSTKISTDISLGGALGMQNGEHHDVPNVAPGSKFYTVGRARYKPFANFNNAEERDWLNVLPLDYARLTLLLRDIYSQDDTVDDCIQNLRDRWGAYVTQNLLAHSGLVGSEFTPAGQTGRYAFDIKLVHQEPTRVPGLDLNRDMTRIDAIDKLRAIRTVLTTYLPKAFLKVLFRGWIHLDLDEENPNVDPFTDMVLDDFNSQFDDFFYPLPFIDPTNTYLQFQFQLGQAGAYENLQDLQGGAVFKGPYLEASAYGERFSKFFDAGEALKMKESSEFRYENESGFVFAKSFDYGILITAFGGSIKGLVKLLASETQSQIFIAIPHAAKAYAHGRQECPTEVLVDIDLAAEVIQVFRAKATIPLPPLTDEQIRRFKNPYADALYEAMRANVPEEIEHKRCSTTGFPHIFYLQLTKL